MGEIRGDWAEAYRKKWTWDSVTWGSHSVDCYPGGCPFRVYTKDGKIVREEQAGTLSPIESGIPDMNPMGCQKGACLEPLPLLAGPRHHAPQAGRGARRGQVRGDLLGPGAHRDRRRHPRCHRGSGTGVGRHPLHTRGGCGQRAVLQRRAGPADHRRQCGVPGLQSRLAPDLGALQPRRHHGRLVPGGADADLARQSGLHQHPVVPLRGRVPLQRRRGGDDRAGLQPLGDPRRLPPAGADRHRRGAGPGDVQGDHRRGVSTRSTSCRSRPICRCWCARTTAASCAAATWWRASGRTSSTGGTR